jgi:uncharacterized protein (DUF1778 family)
MYVQRQHKDYQMALAQRAEHSASRTRTPKNSKASSAGKPKKQKAPTSKVYNLRVDDATDRLIVEALALLGQSRTEFMLASAKVRAQEVLLNRTHFTLSTKAWKAFEEDLEAPVAPTAELIALMSRKPQWEK